MTHAQMADVLALYKKKLDELLDDGWAANTQLRHAATMLPKMEAMLQSAEVFPCLTNALLNYDKFNRWLGFMQGVFFCNQIYTLDEMKSHNRKPEV